MSGGFSSAVKLADLDDFLGPSQACVKPLMEEKSAKVSAISPEDFMPRVAIHFPQIQEAGASKAAKVTLNDCLACSGCVTSAETVLIEAQSLDKLKEELALGSEEPRKYKFAVCLVSRASLGSIAHHYGLTLKQTLWKVRSFLKAKCKVDMVLDGSWAADLSLKLAREEFIQRYKEGLVTLCGECPGFVCYSEKTQHQLLSLLSKVKSPQEIAAAVVKHHLTTVKKVKAEEIFHFAVMPCFDKKLEATREKFLDLVVATREFLDLLEELEFKEYKDGGDDERVDDFEGLDALSRYPVLQNTGSGGYLESIYRYAAKELFGITISPETELEYKINKRNPDFQELLLEVGGEVQLRFAKAYGFKNIQNLVRKLKLSKDPYHYVEVMACPSGCVNGGGQIPTGTAKSKHREIGAAIEGILSKDLLFQDPSDNPLADSLWKSLLSSKPELSTAVFNAVESSETLGLVAKW